MRLGDLQLAMELQAALARLDEIGGSAILSLDDGSTIEFSAEETAAFVDWRRRELHRQLRALGVEPDEAQAGGGCATPGDLVFIEPQAPATRRVLSVETAASPPALLDRAAAREIAIKRMFGPRLAMRDKGELDDPGKPGSGDEKFDRLLDKNRADVERMTDEILAGPPPPRRCPCGAPATTAIAGLDYCDEHAAAAPRMPSLDTLRMSR